MPGGATVRRVLSFVGLLGEAPKRPWWCALVEVLPIPVGFLAAWISGVDGWHVWAVYVAGLLVGYAAVIPWLAAYDARRDASADEHDAQLADGGDRRERAEGQGERP